MKFPKALIVLSFALASGDSAHAQHDGHSKLDKWDGYLAERNAIFDFLHENDINGVVLISGDRHRSDARRIDRENGYALYDFMSAIPTNYHTHPLVKGPGYLFGHNEKNTFGMLHFDTTLDDPIIRFEIICIDGESIWSYELRLSELGIEGRDKVGERSRKRPD